MKYSYLLLFLFSTLVYGEPLFYFHPASSWTYKVKGNKIYEVTNKVVEVKTIDGQKWYKLIEYGDTFWVTNKEQGQFEAINFFDRNPSKFEKAEEVLVFKYPAKVGETWDNYNSPTTYLGVEKVVVPAGEFKCHMYKIDMGNGNYSKSCIAQHVGIVYNEAKLDDKPKEISELLYYK